MSKSTNTKKAEEPVNIPENTEVSAVGLSAAKQASKAEQKAAKKSDRPGFNANRLENPHASNMSVDQAKAVIKKYGDFKGETPAELKRARDIVSRAK